MVNCALFPADSVLPHLLALPQGVVAGLPSGPGGDGPELALALGAFGPLASSESQLRHAARRAPARVVVHAGHAPAAVVGAALSALQRAGAVVVLRSPDIGRLVEACERVLVAAEGGMRWIMPEDLRAHRCLMLRVAGAAGWCRVPLGAGPSAEAVLARFAAEGRRVCESRIAYMPSCAR